MPSCLGRMTPSTSGVQPSWSFSRHRSMASRLIARAACGGVARSGALFIIPQRRIFIVVVVVVVVGGRLEVEPMRRREGKPPNQDPPLWAFGPLGLESGIQAWPPSTNLAGQCRVQPPTTAVERVDPGHLVSLSAVSVSSIDSTRRHSVDGGKDP